MPPTAAPLLLLLLLLSICRTSLGCLQDPAAAYRFTGAVCRLTYPAAVVLNEKTTRVIEAAFQHARYPSVRGEKSLLFIGKVSYGLDNLEINNLTIGQSTFELHPGKGIAMEIHNVSAVFRGTIQYGYGSWLVNLANNINFEIESQIDLGINPRLYCGAGKVAADTSDCYLNFDKFRLHLEGDRQPNWLKKLFTDFVSFTVRLAIKGQICKEINKLANILADFIQERAEQFLSDGDISMDIGVTAAPVIAANYIESYHKGLTKYHNISSVINDSAFRPDQLTEHRMLYFWVSDQMLNPVLAAAHQDGRFRLNVSTLELRERLKTRASIPQRFRECLFEPGSPELQVWSSSLPFLNTSTSGTRVWASASGKLLCGNPETKPLLFQTEVEVDVTASYAEKKVLLHGWSPRVAVTNVQLPAETPQELEEASTFIREAVTEIGVPKVLSVLETEVTRLLDKQGANLFDIFNPEVLPREGHVVIQMDFGFPHHLLVDFLRRTLE